MDKIEQILVTMQEIKTNQEYIKKSQEKTEKFVIAINKNKKDKSSCLLESLFENERPVQKKELKVLEVDILENKNSISQNKKDIRWLLVKVAGLLAVVAIILSLLGLPKIL